jgi:chemotaxis protein methyltransferase CheR
MESQIRFTETLPESYRFLQRKIYAHVGIVLGDDRNYLIEGRLASVVNRLGLQSINDLCELLRAEGNAELGRMVAEAMTTNETYFFREPAHYEAIRSGLLPKLVNAQQGKKRLRFWSAASSTGQEAHSLAMLLFEEGLQDWDIEILGTDFCSHVVDRANSGLYSQLEVSRGLPTRLLIKYFLRSGLKWQLIKPVLQLAQFRTLDLRTNLRTLGPFDLVFLRNVMIYFDASTRLHILREIHSTMYRGGWLLLGGAETTTNCSEWFERSRIGNTIVYVAR